MKKIILFLILLFIGFQISIAEGRQFGFQGLEGTGSYPAQGNLALDGWPVLGDAGPPVVPALSNNDFAMGGDSGFVYIYDYDPSSSAAENVPFVVKPNDNAGNGRWLLLEIFGPVLISGTPVANDIPRFTDGSTIEGLSYSEFKAALDLEAGTDFHALDADLTHGSDLDHGTRYKGLAVYDASEDDAFIWVFAGDTSGDDVGSVATNAALLGAETQNIEATDFGLGCAFFSGTATDVWNGTIYEVAVCKEAKVKADGTNFAQGEYGEPPISWQSASMAAGPHTSAGSQTLTITTDREGFLEDGDMTVILETGVDDVVCTYSTKGGTGNLECYFDCPFVAGSRSLDLAFKTDTATLSSGATFTDAQNAACTLTGLSGINITNDPVVAVPKDANSPFEVKPSGGDATTVLGLETAVDHLVSGDYVVAQSTAESYTATVAGVIYRILSVTDFDADGLAITIYGTNRISGSLTNSGSATLYPYNPPRVTN